MNQNLRDKRRSRATDELVGERGAEGRQAVRWEELEKHPFIQRLWQEVQVAKTTGGSGDTSAIEADIDTLQSDMTTVQSDVIAAQTDATNAGNTASTALSDAADAQAVADAGAADWVTLKANYEAVTVTLDGSGYISGWRATTWADLDGSGGGVLELLGDVIVPGTLAANRLTVGLQANDFINSDFMAPLAPNWVTSATSGGTGAATTISINPAGDPYAWLSFPTLSAYQSDGSTDGFYKFSCYPVMDIAGTLAPGFAVTPGERVSFSARVSAQRCTGSIEIQWRDGVGNLISIANDSGDPGVIGVNGSTSSAGPVGSDSNPDLWDLLWIVADAPALAAYYNPVFRKGPSGSGDANSEMFVARPMHCRVHGDAVTPTPYSPEGTTLIDGERILTGSVTADKITVASLDALSANLGTIEVGTANIADAAIDSAKLAGTIQSDDFVAGNSGWRINKAGSAEFQDVTIRAIQTADIADGAISETYGAEIGPTALGTAVVDQLTTIFTQAVSTTGRPVTVTATVTLTPSSGPAETWLWIEKGGTRISERWESGDYSSPITVTLTTTAVGSGTYRLQAQSKKAGFSANATQTTAWSVQCLKK